jgi:hypothetical protein
MQNLRFSQWLSLDSGFVGYCGQVHFWLYTIVLEEHAAASFFRVESLIPKMEAAACSSKRVYNQRTTRSATTQNTTIKMYVFHVWQCMKYISHPLGIHVLLFRTTESDLHIQSVTLVFQMRFPAVYMVLLLVHQSSRFCTWFGKCVPHWSQVHSFIIPIAK